MTDYGHPLQFGTFLTPAAEDPDLFWALRGAGANVGVLLSVEATAARLGEVALGQFVYPSCPRVLRRSGRR